jgi:hypothetical protein
MCGPLHASNGLEETYPSLPLYLTPLVKASGCHSLIKCTIGDALCGNRLYFPRLVSDSLGSLEEDPLSTIQMTHQRARGSAQVRAATAQVQRRKWALERSRFGADYIGSA